MMTTTVVVAVIAAIVMTVVVAATIMRHRRLAIPSSADLLDELTRLAIAREKRQADDMWIHKVTAHSEIKSILESSRGEQWRRLKNARRREAEARRDQELDRMADQLLVKHDPVRSAARIAELEAELAMKGEAGSETSETSERVSRMPKIFQLFT